MITIKKDHLKSGHRVRPGKKISLSYITIHSTGNPGSSAASERKWLDNPDNKRDASWHLVIDDKECVEAIPLNEMSWHAGSGNSCSIGIEICESGDRAKTIERAAELTAALLRHYGLTTSHLKRHYDWTQKSCPGIMMANNWKGWTDFKGKVKYYYDQKASFSYGTTATTSSKVNVGVTTADSLNVRREPKVTTDNIVEKLPKGSKVRIYDTTNGFYKIDGGYVSADYVTASYDATLEKVPVVEETKKEGLNILVDNRLMTVDGKIEDGKTYIAMRELCELIGYEVGFDDVKKLPSIKKKTTSL